MPPLRAALLLLIGHWAFVIGHSARAEPVAVVPAHPLARVVTPILDTPLRDAAITRSPDGSYYLTGTSASANPRADGLADFGNNDGIHLWSSPDLVTWKHVDNIGPLAGPLVRGFRAPELHFIADTGWIASSMSNGDTDPLKSPTGRPEGPYADVGLMTIDGAAPSLFQDDDGTVYWLYGDGWLARLKEDLSDLAEAPRQILAATFYTVFFKTPPARDHGNYASGKFGFHVHQPDLGEHIEITPERKKAVDGAIWSVVNGHPYTQPKVK